MDTSVLFLILSLIIIITVSIYLIVHTINEPLYESFNSLQDRIALYEHPNECPFEYIRLYEDKRRSSGDRSKFILESKLFNHPKELDIIFDSIDEFQESWEQLKHVFPNVALCGDPYERYIRNYENDLEKNRKLRNLPITTVPLYQQENFTGNNTSHASVSIPPPTSEQLPSIYENHNIHVRNLTHSINDDSQVNAPTYQSPNTPNTNTNEQIDTSVLPVSDIIPNVYTDRNIQIMKNKLMEDKYETQREYHQKTLEMTSEIEQLQREIDNLREELIFEKQHSNDIYQSLEEKHQKIMDSNDTNVQLTKKLGELEHKNKILENMYQQSDSQKVQMEVKLNNVRTSVEEGIKHKGYSYIPPSHWSVSQWRPPLCLTSEHNLIEPYQYDKQQFQDA